MRPSQGIIHLEHIVHHRMTAVVLITAIAIILIQDTREVQPSDLLFEGGAVTHRFSLQTPISQVL